jgi:hypothetical protein
MGRELGPVEKILREAPSGRLPQREDVALSMWLTHHGRTTLTSAETELYRLARYYGWRAGLREAAQGRFTEEGRRPLYPVVIDQVLDVLRDGPKTSREVWEAMPEMTPHYVRVKIHQLKASGRVAIAVKAEDNFGKAIYKLGPKAPKRAKRRTKRVHAAVGMGVDDGC